MSEQGHGKESGGFRVTDALMDDMEGLTTIMESFVTIMFLGIINAPGRRSSGGGRGGH